MPSNADVTPLPQLPEQWRSTTLDKPLGPLQVMGYSAAMHEAADDLERSLAAASAPHREVARELRDALWKNMRGRSGFDPGDHGVERDVQDEWREEWRVMIASALASARREAWKVCFDGVEHNWNRKEIDSAKCYSCGVNKLAVTLVSGMAASPPESAPEPR